MLCVRATLLSYFFLGLGKPCTLYIILRDFLGKHNFSLPHCTYFHAAIHTFCAPVAFLSRKKMNDLERGTAKRRLRMAYTILATVPGIPAIFYGDEAGHEGYHDPFCRRPFPWGRENKELLEHYKTLGRIRNEHPVFIDGEFKLEKATGGVLVYSRRGRGEHIKIMINLEKHDVNYPVGHGAKDILNGIPYGGRIRRGRAAIVLCRDEVDNGTV